MDIDTKRRLSRFLRFAHPIADLVALALITAMVFRYFPREVLGSEPATGGDTGSHFWTLYGLVEHALPDLSVRYWNPGNHAGEPRLLHYFPLPFLIMAAMASVVPIGTAYNIGTVLGTIMFPYAVYAALRGAGLRFPIPILGTAVALISHYNESYSMWGGNTLSTLAGQFAASYGIDFLLFGIGALCWEIRTGRFQILSSLFFAATLLSHGYPALSIPIFLASITILFPHAELRARLLACATSAVFSLLLSVWFVGPMLLNGKWQTKHALSWFSDTILQEVYPAVYHPFVNALGIILLLLALASLRGLEGAARKRFTAAGAALVIGYLGHQLFWAYDPNLAGALQAKDLPKRLPLYATLALGAVFAALYACLLAGRFRPGRKKIFLDAAIWLVPTLANALLYYILPLVELIDIRAVPQVHIFGCLFFAVLAGHLLNALGRLSALLLTFPLVITVMWWTHNHVQEYPGWLQWNVSGWRNKPLYPAVSQLSRSVKGSYSDPRIIFELSDKANATGTIRVWEMLPYFAGRATLESVYLEATLMSGEAVHLQAEISKFPSCPLPHLPCPTFNVAAARPRLELMGVGALIMANDEPIAQARASGFLQEPGTANCTSCSALPGRSRFGPWTLFYLAPQPALAGVFRQAPELYTGKDWRDRFYNWFREYDGAKRFLIAAENLDPSLRQSLERGDAIWSADSSCHPKLKADFNRIELSTDCPGKAHYLKFNYHPAWRVSTGDPLFIVSPAFIGIVPSQPEVVLEFGYMLSWKITQAISMLSGLILFLCCFGAARKRTAALARRLV